MILLRWLAGVAFVIAASRALAAPSSPGLAEKAAQEFIARRYPVTQAGGRSAGASGPSALAIRKVEALAGPGWTLGYVSNPDPAGYVLLRADDEVSAVKLYSDARCFANLPPGFLWRSSRRKWPANWPPSAPPGPSHGLELLAQTLLPDTFP